MPRPTRRSRQLLLLTASVLVSLLLAEGLWRLFHADAAGSQLPVIYTENGVRVPLSEIVHFMTRFQQFDANANRGEQGPHGGQQANVKFRIGYDPKPAWDYFDSNGCVSVAVNSLGFRDFEFQVDKQPGEFRAIALGDSFTWGQGVRVDLTWPKVLEAALRKSRPTPVTVINAGFACGPGVHSPDGYDRWMASDGVRFHPDLVIVGICLNDLGDVQLLSYPVLGDQPVLGGWSHLLNSLVRIWRQRQVRLEQRDLTHVVTDHPERWQGTQRGLLALRDLLAKEGVPLVVAVFPMLTQLDRYPYAGLHRMVGEFCDRSGIRCFDLLPAFAGKTDEDYWVHPTDQHPNHVGHRIMAEQILDYLVRERLLGTS